MISLSTIVKFDVITIDLFQVRNCNSRRYHNRPISSSTFIKLDVVPVDVLKMGETLGISHNVAEEMERKRDRKERLKKYEEWQKEQEKRKLKLKDMQAR